MTMNTQHPITPPTELVQQWADMLASRSDQAVFSMVAQWGSDMQLEAMLAKLEELHLPGGYADALRALCRPKPPSLKKQAYDALDTYIYGEPDPKVKERTYNTIRRALEALDE